MTPFEDLNFISQMLLFHHARIVKESLNISTSQNTLQMLFLAQLSLAHQIHGVLAISIRDFCISVAMSSESGPSLITWREEEFMILFKPFYSVNFNSVKSLITTETYRCV